MHAKKFATRIALVGAAAGLVVGAGTVTASANTGAGYVGPGDTNNAHAVWCVQKLIDDSGVTPSIATDGIFGPKTETAIKTFQKRAYLHPDGVVGPNTGDALLDNFYDYYDNYCYTYLPTTY